MELGGARWTDMRGWFDALATSTAKSVVRGGRADRVTATVRRDSDGGSCLLLVGGACLLERGLTAANRVAHSSGAALASNNRLNSARMRIGRTRACRRSCRSRTTTTTSQLQSRRSLLVT